MTKTYEKSRNAATRRKKLSPKAIMGGVFKILSMYFEKSLAAEEAIEMIRKIIA